MADDLSPLTADEMHVFTCGRVHFLIRVYSLESQTRGALHHSSSDALQSVTSLRYFRESLRASPPTATYLFDKTCGEIEKGPGLNLCLSISRRGSAVIPVLPLASSRTSLKKKQFWAHSVDLTLYLTNVSLLVSPCQ